MRKKRRRYRSYSCSYIRAFPGAQGVKVDAETQDDASGRDRSRFASLGRGVLLTGLAAESIVCTQTPSGV